MKAIRLLPAALLAIVVGTCRQSAADDISGQVDNVPLNYEGKLPSLSGATKWLNSPPWKASDLRGKVLVINFWTYTCINSQRPLPYIRAWAKKYKDDGLIVIGVHTPEFAFEKNVENVRKAVKELDVDYPVAVDSDHAVWSTFKNDYWPAFYFVDAQGRIRHRQRGEGGYDTAESVIQQLLTEAGATGLDRNLVKVEGHGSQAAPDWDDIKTPETYVGYLRSDSFSSPGGAFLGRRRNYAAPSQWNLNDWSLSGVWTVGKPSAVLNRANGRIGYRFHARDLHLVMGPATPGASVRYRVFIDGKPAGAAHGSDVDEQGNGTVTEPRLYQLIRQAKPIADREFEIEFLDPGVEVFSFTFG